MIVAQKRRPGHQTQWAAQFAVASELCKRGYEVALTMGNHPTADIMVRSPFGRHFDVDVKGLYKRNFWPVRWKEPRQQLFYIFAFVPDSEKNLFFIIPQEVVNSGIRDNTDKAMVSKEAKGMSYDEVKDVHGVSWRFAEDNCVGWNGLPK